MHGSEARLSDEDLTALKEAKAKLEHPSFTARVSAIVGRPVETGLKLLPASWNSRIGAATEAALLTGLDFSIRTMGRGGSGRSQDRLHKVFAAGMGAAGGAIGLAALPVELPLSTCVMLRSIADIARAEGHDLSQLEVKLACLEVFALGGKAPGDDAAESSYWLVRAALSKYVAEAAEHIAKKGITDKGAPALLRLVTQIASRFSVVITEEAAAKAIPVVGAVSGAAINYLFLDHFQDVASGHFVIKRLEMEYGTELVRKTYDEREV